jgi:hypothetical protein
MHDLDAALRQYFDKVTDPIEAEPVVAGRRPVRQPAPPRLPGWRRPALAFVGMLLLVVIAVGIPMFLLGDGEGSVADTTVPTSEAPTTVPPTTLPSTTAPPTTAAPTTTTPPLVQGPMTWSRMPFDGQVRAVAAGNAGLIAAGTADGTTALWRSPDGRTWTRVALDDATFGGYWIHDLVATPDGYAAIGRDRETAVVAWTSPDGLEWVRNSAAGFAQSEIGRVAINALTYGPAGFVAVGWTTRPGEPWMMDDHIVIHSADGTMWQRVDTTDLAPGGMKDVTAGGPGYVAVGIDWSGPGGPGVWTSADGLDWMLIESASVERDTNDGLAEMDQVAVADDGRLYAFGLGPVWVSENGSTWSRLGHYVGEPEDGFASAWSGFTNASVVSGDRIVLVGALEFRGGEGEDRAAVWATEDGGITWERMSRPLDVFGDLGMNVMESVAEIDGTYVAFGAVNGEANVWVGAWYEEEGS